MDSLVQLEHLSKSYRKLQALNDVSLTIGKGITGLLGPNGAGKSTLIKVIMGLLRVNGGGGTVLGYRLGRQGRQIRARVGYMPEDDCYFTGMTGIEMVKFSACLGGMTPIEGLRRSHEILDFCGVHQERYRSVEGYSTGMRQKVKFAAALVHDPELLVLDEPTSGLDPEERTALLNRVRTLCERFGKSALISTHILPDVQTVCDHVIILSRGRVRVADDLSVLNAPRDPRFVAQVLGDQNGFSQLLEQAGINSEVAEHGSLLLRLPDGNAFRRVWQLCQEHNIVLRSLAPMKNSLEEIFMDAIREETDAHS